MMPAAPKESSRARLIMAQWAIGDWLVDGKSHYGDGLYERAAGILNVEISSLRTIKSVTEKYEMLLRNNNLSWNHHKELSAIKKVSKSKSGKMSWGEDHDMGKAQELLARAEIMSDGACGNMGRGFSQLQTNMLVYAFELNQHGFTIFSQADVLVDIMGVPRSRYYCGHHATTSKSKRNSLSRSLVRLIKRGLIEYKRGTSKNTRNVRGYGLTHDGMIAAQRVANGWQGSHSGTLPTVKTESDRDGSNAPARVW